MKVELWGYYTSYSPCIMKLSKIDEGPSMVYAQIQQEITRKKKRIFPPCMRGLAWLAWWWKESFEELQ